MPTNPRPRTRARSLFAAIGLTLVTAGCGETYINEEATATTADPQAAPSTTLPPVDPDASADELLGELAGQLSDLSEKILDKEQPDAAQARINEIWVALEPKLADNAASQMNVGIVVDLANLAVDRKRPADADKASKLLRDVIKAR